MRFLAFDQAHDADYFEAEFAGSFDGLDSGRSGGANIVHNHHCGAFLREAFDASGGTVLFLRLAHQETMNRPTGYGYCDHDRIGAHRETADGFRFPFLLTNLLQKYLASQLRAAAVKRRGAAVNVVVTACARGQLEIADAKRLLREHLEQFLLCDGHELSTITAVLGSQHQEHSAN